MFLASFRERQACALVSQNRLANPVCVLRNTGLKTLAESGSSNYLYCRFDIARALMASQVEEPVTYREPLFKKLCQI